MFYCNFHFISMEVSFVLYERYYYRKKKTFTEEILNGKHHFLCNKRQEPLKVSHYSAKFGGHRHYSSEGKIFLVSLMIQQDQVSNESSNFMRGSHFKVSHHPTNFGGHIHCGIGDIMLLVCHLEPIKVSYHPAKFGDHRYFDSGDIMVFCLSRDLARTRDQVLKDFMVKCP